MIEWIITSSLMIIIIIILRFLFHNKISQRLQYALWGLVLLRLLLPVSLFESSFSIMNIISHNEEKKQISVLPIPNSKQLIEKIDTNRTNNKSVLAENTTNTNGYIEKVMIYEVIKFIWFIGAIIIGIWLIGINFLFNRQLRKMRKPYFIMDYKLPVYLVEHIASPCLFGIIHPTVYLTPKAVEKENSRYVLTHELCHYYHGDHIWSILRSICFAIWWWNPLVWAAVILSKQDSELACDEAVIKQIGKDNYLKYAQTLIDMIIVKKSSANLMCSATTMISGKKEVKERLNRIISMPKSFLPVMIVVLFMIIISAICIFTSAKINNDNMSVSNLSKEEVSQVKYQLMLGRRGEIVSLISPLSNDNIELLGEMIINHRIKSLVFPSTDIKTLDKYYIINVTDLDNVTKNYYVYQQEDQFLIQSGETREDGCRTFVSDEHNKEFTKLFENNLETYISEAIMISNKRLHADADFATEAHTILKTIENKNKVTVYAMVLYSNFSYQSDGGFKEEGGSHMPVAITFKKTISGEYRLKEYWRPEDGSYYASSIKKKFPADIYTRALDTQAYIEQHTNICYKKAEAFEYLNIYIEIEQLFKIIISSPKISSNPEDYIKTHKVEFEKLVNYRQHTLEYCFKLFEKGSQNDLNSYIMARVCCSILENKDIDFKFNTGQEWYKKFKKQAKLLKTKYKKEEIEKYFPEEWLLLQLIE